MQDRLADEAGVDAVICLQSELCHEALQIEWGAIRRRAVERCVLMTRVAVRDFDHNDQVLVAKCRLALAGAYADSQPFWLVARHCSTERRTMLSPALGPRTNDKKCALFRQPPPGVPVSHQALMLPEAVRMLYLLVSMGKRVYVHCTAGINRATLTVVGYLTFVLGTPLDQALAQVKAARPQAHPYVDCWRVCAYGH